MNRHLLYPYFIVVFSIATVWSARGSTLVFNIDLNEATFSMSGELSDTAQLVPGPNFYEMSFSNGIPSDVSPVIASILMADPFDLVTGNYSPGVLTILENGHMSFYFQVGSSTINLTGTEKTISFSEFSGLDDLFNDPPAGALTLFSATTSGGSSTIPINVIPEPATSGLAALALCGWALARKRTH